jgi:hypothetical protein
MKNFVYQCQFRCSLLLASKAALGKVAGQLFFLEKARMTYFGRHDVCLIWSVNEDIRVYVKINELGYQGEGKKETIWR